MKNQIEQVKKIKALFELCELMAGQTISGVSVVEDAGVFEQEIRYRVYHKDGYCFDVSKEKIDMDERNSYDSLISGCDYTFDEGVFDGFERITLDDAIKLLETPAV